MLAAATADAMVMATISRQTSPRAVRFIATIAASGATLGLVLAASRSDGAAAACGAAARRAGTCVPGALLSAKPVVAACLIGLLLGALIAIAAVLTWREARAVLAPPHARRTPRPRRGAARHAHRHGFAVAHRPRH
jgi:hypothetical protein